ncbi:MAG: hypothetical protein ABEJ22_05655 [Haloferacaceae archaeon]
MRDDRRGQLSLSVVEVTVGLVLVATVAAGFGVGVPAPDVERAQLDRYAADAGTLLADDPAPSGDGSLLAVASRTPEGFAATSGALDNRTAELLPGSVLYRVETPQGAVGYRPPDGIPVGRASVPTLAGTVTVRVWYA